MKTPKPNILYVDDELFNLEGFQVTFRRHFNISIATSAAEALGALAQKDFEVLITDQRMPDMTGLELIAKVREVYPDVVCVVLSAYVDVEAIFKAINELGVYRYLIKPWEESEMLMSLNNALETYNLRKQNKVLIDDLRKTNGELMLNQNKLKEAQKIAQLGYWEADLVKRMIFLSEEVKGIIDLNSDSEQIGFDYFFNKISPDAYERYRATLEKATPGTESFTIEHKIDSEGEQKFIQQRFRMRFDEQHEPVYALGMMLDVTEKRKAEIELENALAKVEELKNRLEEENFYLKQEIKLDHNFEEIISDNAAFKLVLKQIEQVAPTDASVLIQGETGTGKELIARAIHSISQRADRSMVKLNCAAIPASLIESELFGHEKGAFTGAIQQKKGRFELANGGTIFLDEIGELPIELQSKLLRVLQEGEYERIGGTKTLFTDVRVIAATNRDLQKEIKANNFRSDLYFRLNVFPVSIPALRERKEDIKLLVEHFVSRFNKKSGKNVTIIPKPVLEILMAYSWPGNIRELENIIERAVIISRGKNLELGNWFKDAHDISGNDEVLPLDEYEKNYILKVLNKSNWRISGANGAASQLGMKPTTLESRMKKLGIKRPK